MIIRDESRDDIRAVRQVIVAAFGRAEEADLVDMLRQSGDAVISLVAEDDGEIVAQVMFSRLRAPAHCVALAPVSVTPSRQKQGFGSRLIRHGIARAKHDGWRAVFVLGEPEYYRRFDFSGALAGKFETPYPRPYFMALELTPGCLSEGRGAVIHAPAFRTLD
ncbi:MAG: N-acetyltransferase [Alphaproteobacteria bacterium]|jgi:putative acetyltransferase|nr:N-acetyltransferase [Alphaproteobacteria bacterium]MDP6590495.1 N-acetyltransferase [Alphaproteobacteria bacterium]MDP6816942.1 N-acetyltransferase [Alphaproteobacteria bacterium]|tara:strand:+ start:71 stop:559 length:489 start_codon:yes stop_codon:yes gene_type:complete